MNSICISGYYDNEWNTHWSNPQMTHQRIFVHSDCVEVHCGHHQIRVDKDELIELSKGKFHMEFISKSSYGHLFYEGYELFNFNKVKEIELTYDHSDEQYIVHFVTKQGERLYCRCSAHTFIGGARVHLIKSLRAIIPIKEYYSDGCTHEYIQTL